MLKSPLRWAGSKSRLLKHLLEQSPKAFERYVEPFAGSAVLFFALNPKKSLLGDINPHLINFYQQFQKTPWALHRTAVAIEATEQEYNKQRRLFNGSLKKRVQAALFWYLNRRCFNGLYRTNLQGSFNVPFGSKLPEFPSLALSAKCSILLRKAEIVCGSYEKILERCGAGDFIYIDPPYKRKSDRHSNEYGVGALRGDITGVLAEALKASNRGAKILFSYNDDLSNKLVSWRKVRINGRYIIGASSSRAAIDEYLYLNY